MAALSGGLHAIAFDLLHGVDLLRGGGQRRAVGDGVSHDLYWPVFGHDRMVVGLRKLVRIGRTQRVTSIADLISSRYGKSNLLAVGSRFSRSLAPRPILRCNFSP